MIHAFRQFANELSRVRFSGASGPVEFLGADRTGIMNVQQYVGNKSHLIGQYKATGPSKEKELTLHMSAIDWLSGGKPSDGRQGSFLFLFFFFFSSGFSHHVGSPV